MYPNSYLSGQESGRELLDLRRDRVRERRIRKASRILGTVLPVYQKPENTIIRFPEPESPKIA